MIYNNMTYNRIYLRNFYKDVRQEHIAECYLRKTKYRVQISIPNRRNYHLGMHIQIQDNRHPIWWCNLHFDLDTHSLSNRTYPIGLFGLFYNVDDLDMIAHSEPRLEPANWRHSQEYSNIDTMFSDFLPEQTWCWAGSNTRECNSLWTALERIDEIYYHNCTMIHNYL